MILRGWKYAAFLSVIVGSVTAAMYPIFIEPIFNVEKYKKIQAKNRENVVQEKIQPGNMKVWSDPFDRKT